MKISVRWIFFSYLFLLHLGLALTVWKLFSSDDKYYFILVEIGIAISFYLGIFLILKITKTLTLIRSGMDMLREQDFSIHFRKTGFKDTDELVEVYNRMVDLLRSERLELEEMNLFLDRLIQVSPSGIIIFDYDGHIQTLNPSALHLTGLSKELLGNLPDDFSHPIFQIIPSLSDGESRTISTPGNKTILVIKARFMNRGFHQSFVLLHEVTHEIREAERKAFELLIRLLSHEVNNTIGTVNSLLQSGLFYQTYIPSPDKEDFQTALQVSMERNERLNQFLKQFADVIHLPKPVKNSTSVNDIFLAIKYLFSHYENDLETQLLVEIQDEPIYIVADRIQMEQVMINIVKNAIQAAGSKGVVKVYVIKETRVKIVVEDSGPGVSEEAKEKLFTPFFTTKADGNGIGLTLVKEILTQHQFSYDLISTPNQPTQFIIEC